MKGMIVSIYKHGMWDATRGGVTSKSNEALLVGDNIPQIFEPHEGMPVLMLVKRRLFDDEEYMHAQPVTGSGYMFGGNFIFSSDGRFPSRYPIPVHDRQEG